MVGVGSLHMVSRPTAEGGCRPRHHTHYGACSHGGTSLALGTLRLGGVAAPRNGAPVPGDYPPETAGRRKVPSLRRG